MQSPKRATQDDGGRGRYRLGAVVSVALAAAFLVWVVFVRGDDREETVTDQSDQTQQVRAIGPIQGSRTDLLELQEEAGHPVYWLGEMEGKEIEVTRTTDGNIYVRYLDSGTDVGEEAPFPTVSTYPFVGAFEALEVVAERPGSISERLEDGGMVLRAGESATSVYVAWPDQDVQVEIFSPDAQQALGAATSERLMPIE
jgi:hypothetical protein